jgi:integrase
VRLYLEPALGHVKLKQLTPEHVGDWMRDMGERGLSANTRRLSRAVLRRSLRVAEMQGLVARNVAAIADGPKHDRAEARSLTVEQATVLLAAASKHRLHAAVVVMVGLGLRRGEVLGLSWGDLDLDSAAPTAHIRRQLQRVPGRGQELVALKTARSRRDVMLPEFVASALRAHRRRQVAERIKAGPAWHSEHDLVFTTPSGSPQDGRNLNRVVSQIATEAGLGHWHPHELRHSAVSLLLAAKVPLEIISEMVGHSSIRVTKDVYGHLEDRQRAVAAAAMDAIFHTG